MVKIAISAMSDDLESVVCPTFGRCPGFLIVEFEDGQIKEKSFVKNPGETMFRGAGISASQLVASKGCTVVLTGNLGPNSWGVLSTSNIKSYRAIGLKIKDALDQYAQGKLVELTGANVSGGWGGRGHGAGAGRGLGRGARWQ